MVGGRAVIIVRGNAKEDDISMLFRHLRVLSQRDRDKTVTHVFRVMLSREKPVGSTDVARISGLNRITCIHHLRRLESAGIVERERRKYRLRYATMEALAQGMREEMERAFDEIDEMAKRIDCRSLAVGGDRYGRKKR
jgi:predicted transcriptional regulator